MRILYACAFIPLLAIADDSAIRKEIQAIYDRALQLQLTAKTPSDLDANEKLIDTQDWTSIVNDGAPQRWADVRGFAIQTLGHPDDIAIKIVKFTVSGDRAIVIARVGPSATINGNDSSLYRLVRDTWIKTSAGWRRKIHEKPAVGKLDAELK